LIEDNRETVRALAEALLELETLDADQIADIMSGKPPRPPKPAGAAGSSGGTTSSDGTQGAAAPAAG